MYKIQGRSNSNLNAFFLQYLSIFAHLSPVSSFTFWWIGAIHGEWSTTAANMKQKLLISMVLRIYSNQIDNFNQKWCYETQKNLDMSLINLKVWIRQFFCRNRSPLNVVLSICLLSTSIASGKNGPGLLFTQNVRF